MQAPEIAQNMLQSYQKKKMAITQLYYVHVVDIGK